MNAIMKVIRKLYSPVYRILRNSTTQRVLIGAVYLLLFTFLLSSDLFVNRPDIKPGDISPTFITATYPKVIEDPQQWEKDKEAAASKVPDVVEADDNMITNLASQLTDTFTALRTVQADTQPDNKSKITKLKGTIPFTNMPDDVLAGLLQAPLNNITAAELDGGRVIVDVSGNPKTGALTTQDIPALKSRLKAAIAQLDFSGNLKAVLNGFVDAKIISPTLQVDKDQTEVAKQAAIARVPIPKYSYTTGEKIVGVGEKVTDQTYLVLQAYGLVQTTAPMKAAAGIGLVVLASMLTILIYLYHYKRQLFGETSNLVLLGLIMALVLALGKGAIALDIGNYKNLLGFLIPLAWGSMLIAILIDSQIAIVVTSVMALFLGIMVDPQFHSQYGLQVAVVTGLGGIAGVYSVSNLSQRSDLARAGLLVGAANVVAVLAVWMISGLEPKALAVGTILAAINGIIASVFTVGTLHWFETGFKITSAVRLLELSDPNRPLLRRLLTEAPGTYHHSILVGNLAEAGAEVVGANALLVRVGAMYHDIGKLKRPYFFIENQFSSDNPHDKIAPTLSTLIITSHIKDGVELAKEAKLPEPILDIIEQHHANGLVTFFYHKAKEGEKPETIGEAEFRYDAPKPQTKEAALVCLADSVEAAVKSLKDSAPGQVSGMIHKIIKDKLNDGQLDESDLTFRDLSEIAGAFDRVLGGIFHNRIEYPEIKDFEGRKNRSASRNK